MAAGMEAQNHLGTCWIFDPEALDADRDTTV